MSFRSGENVSNLPRKPAFPVPVLKAGLSAVERVNGFDHHDFLTDQWKYLIQTFIQKGERNERSFQIKQEQLVVLAKHRDGGLPGAGIDILS
jgi:hypothetical protein